MEIIYKKPSNTASPVLTIPYIMTLNIIKTAADLVDESTSIYKAVNFIPIHSFIV